MTDYNAPNAHNLNELLNLSIPGPSRQPDGFLEIAGVAHKENVNSRIYAHFLNSEIPAVRSCFLNALIGLVFEKTGKSLQLQNCRAMLENTTDKNYRIDLLVIDESNRSAVIIENKIYHFLSNDLLNYWQHVIYPEENKAGVLLTLHPEQIPVEAEGKFVNIKHSEWVKKIRDNGLPAEIPANYSQYLGDFLNTIERLTKSYIMNEQAKFYFRHAPKVIEAKKTMDEAHGFIEDQLDILCSHLGWQKYGPAREWRNIWDSENELDTFLTIWMEPLLNGEMAFSIIIELMREDKASMPELDLMLADSSQFREMHHKTKSEKNYVQYGVRHYAITEDELERFGDHVYKLILHDFADTIVRIIRRRYPTADISKWIANFNSSSTNGSNSC